jgi:hypothetical protein
LKLPPQAQQRKARTSPSPTEPTFLQGSVSDSLLATAFRWFKPDWRKGYLAQVRNAAKAGDDKMQRYLNTYDKLEPFERQYHYPETVLDLCGVLPEDLYGAVCRSTWATKGAEVNALLAIEHPDVLERTAHFAKTLPENFRDREMFLKMAGSLPLPKNQALMSVHFNNAAIISGGKEAGSSGSQLMSMDDDVIDMNRQLESGGGQVLQMPTFASAEAVEVTVDSTADDDD